MSKKFQSPETLVVAKAVGWVTFLEILRDKVLYNILLCAILLLGAGFLASRLTFISPGRVILDFGLSAVSISCSLIAIFTGASLLNREFERRTVYVALSHPISRAQFVIGKFAGLAGVLVLNWCLLTASYLAILGLSSDSFFENIHTILFAALFFVVLQSLVMASVAILFSTISTTSLTAVITLGLYLVGNNASQIRFVANKMGSGVGSFLLNGVALMIPNLELFNMGTKVTYGLPISLSFALTAVVYSVFVISLCLVLAGILIRSKEV